MILRLPDNRNLICRFDWLLKMIASLFSDAKEFLLVLTSIIFCLQDNCHLVSFERQFFLFLPFDWTTSTVCHVRSYDWAVRKINFLPWTSLAQMLQESGAWCFYLPEQDSFTRINSKLDLNNAEQPTSCWCWWFGIFLHCSKSANNLKVIVKYWHGFQLIRI